MWNDCDVVYEDGEFDYFEPVLNAKIFKAFRTYQTTIGHEPKKKVWFDFVNEVCFGSEQDFYDNPGEFSFFADKNHFLDDSANPHWGMRHVNEKFNPAFDRQITTTEEFIIPENLLALYENKHILIVGAGPSTNDIVWNHVEHDYLWTCNKFYLNDKIDKKTVSLATVGPNVDLSDSNFLKKIFIDNTLCLFEGGVSPFRSTEELNNFKKLHLNTSYFHLRYFSKIGTAARLIVLASLFGAKTVSFVGVDGHPLQNLHSFEKNKIHEGAPLVQNSLNIFRRQYVLLWDYILNDIKNNTKYINLGESHPSNLSSDISRKKYRL